MIFVAVVKYTVYRVTILLFHSIRLLNSYLMVWSQILTVQSELQEMKTFGWKWFHLTESTAMLWASYVSRNWLE